MSGAITNSESHRTTGLLSNMNYDSEEFIQPIRVLGIIDSIE